MKNGFISIPIENEDAYIIRSKAFGRYFRLRWREEGRYRYKSLRTRNYSQALQAAKVLMVKINRGLDPNTPTDYETAFEGYMRALNCGRKRRDQVAHIHYRWLLPFFGKIDVSKISTERWEEYKNWRVNEAVKDSGVVRHKTLLHERSLIQAFLKWCRRKAIINYVPEITGYSKRNEKITLTKQRGAAYTEPEVKRIFEILRSRTDYSSRIKQETYYANMLYVYALTLFFSAGRPGEIRQLKTTDFDFREDKAVINIRSQTSKVKKQRFTSVPKEVAAEIKRFIDWSEEGRLEKSDFVFYCHDCPIRPVATTNQTFRKLMEAEGIYKNDSGILRPISSLRNSALTILSGRVDQAFLVSVSGTSARMLHKHYFDRKAETFADRTTEIYNGLIEED
jgi:integrase